MNDINELMRILNELPETEREKTLRGIKSKYTTDVLIPKMEEALNAVLSDYSDSLQLTVSFKPGRGVKIETTPDADRKCETKPKVPVPAKATFRPVPSNVTGQLVLSEKQLGLFALEVMKFLHGEYSFNPMLPYVSEKTLIGVKLQGAFNLPGLFFKGSEEDLHIRNSKVNPSAKRSRKHIRWYDVPFILDTDTVYLSTTWRDTDDGDRLTLNHLESMIQTCFDKNLFIVRNETTGYELRKQ